jgi:hypothetical protein
MKAEEMRVGSILAAERQYVVPYFQRTYSWRNPQWVTLFEDILELYELFQGSAHTHFLGSMVLLTEQRAEPHATTLVIDGQQRLVTLSLLLAAIRDASRNTNSALADRLQSTYLSNDAAQDGEDRLKVLCTNQDRPAFATVILEAKEPEFSPIRDAYVAFKERLQQETKKGLDLEKLVDIITAQLSLVAITLDHEDNPYRIFESLNAKGMPLTQGDLLRNYFFMRLPSTEHETWYTTVWWPMQRRLGERFDAFMRDFLLKDGESVKPDEVYQEWRKRLGPLGADDIRATLRDLAAWSVEYDSMLHPEREQDRGVRKHLEWLTAWSRTLPQSIDPFILRLHARYRRKEVSAEQAIQLFASVESFLVRRLFTNAPVTDDNQLFIALLNEHADADEFIEALSDPQYGWPKDDDFLNGIVRYPVYFGSHPDRRKLILQALEDTYEHRVAVRYDTLELQLITSLLPRPDWLEEVGVDEGQFWKVIGTLGNLTWVPKGRSGSLPLAVAERKHELKRLARHGLELVRDFASVERWTAEEIEQRSCRMGARAVAVWPGPK